MQSSTKEPDYTRSRNLSRDVTRPSLRFVAVAASGECSSSTTFTVRHPDNFPSVLYLTNLKPMLILRESLRHVFHVSVTSCVERVSSSPTNAMWLRRQPCESWDFRRGGTNPGYIAQARWSCLISRLSDENLRRCLPWKYFRFGWTLAVQAYTPCIVDARRI